MQKLTKAKTKLLLEYPAFGHIISRMEFSQNDDLEAFLSDGKRFEFNDTYIEKASEDELRFALSYAALQKILGYQNRRQKRAKYLWQIATNYAIASMLKQSGYTVPPHFAYRGEFDGMYAEEIYEVLKSEIKNEEFSDDEELESGYNEQNKQHQKQPKNTPKNSSNEKVQMEAELEKQLEQKFLEDLLEKHAKELPAPILRHLKITKKSKIPWQALLRRYIQKMRTNYTLYPPSKKLLYRGIYLPSLQNELLQITIAIDCSGSIDDALLHKFLSETEAILSSIQEYEIELIVADDRVRYHQKFLPGQALPKEVVGGCGTDFRVVFDFIKQKRLQPNLLLFFSDLKGVFPKQKPNFDVVWATKETKETPFGKVLEIL